MRMRPNADDNDDFNIKGSCRTHCWWPYHLYHLCRRTQGARSAPCPCRLWPPSRLRQEGGGASVLPVPQPRRPCHNEPCPRGGCHPPWSHPLFQRGPLHQLRRSCCHLLDSSV